MKGKAAITMRQAESIRRRAKRKCGRWTGVKQEAEKYGVHPSIVSNILAGRTYTGWIAGKR